jgi:cytochrome o ubiquinol oxidase subunit 2
MTFTARAASEQSFNNWVATVKNTNNTLSLSSYGQLAKPSKNNRVEYYSTVDNSLYDGIVSKYMAPNDSTSHEHEHGDDL